MALRAVPGLGRVAQFLWSWLLLAVAAAAAAGSPAGSSPVEPRFESVGVGIIPRHVVPVIAQDRAGFLWVATGDGLMRFDGYRFRPVERPSPDPATRNLGWIRSMLAGRDGRLWIGTEFDGLAVHDPLSETIGTCGGDSRQHGGALPTIRALAEDAAGSIWVGSEGGGLERYDAQCRRIARYRHAERPGSLPDDRVQALLLDRQGVLWLGTWAGLSRHDAVGEGFVPVFAGGGAGTGLAGRIVQALLQASDGRIWAGTQQGELAIVDPATGAGVLLEPTVDAASPGGVSSLVEAPGGQMWVGRVSGIEIRDVRSGALLQRLRHDLHNPRGLAANEVTTLLLDHSGLIWVGGFGVGLQRHDPGRRSLWLRGADRQPGSILSVPDVRSLLQVDNGEIWAATHSGGIAVLDQSLRTTAAVLPRLPVPAGGDDLPTARIEAMAQARDGSVWLGADSWLYQFSADHRQLRMLRHHGGATRKLLAGSDGSLWIGTQDGVFRLPPGATEVARIAQRDGQILRADINALVEAADGSVWVGSGKGLFRVAAGDSQLQAVAQQEGAGLGNPSVIGLLFDRQQTLWVDTAVTGLHRLRQWDGARAAFERISQRHGVLGRPFGGNLMQDGRGRIWTQMCVYDPAGDRLDELTAADGADLGIGWFLAHAMTPDGRMLFGGSKGILVVRPEHFDASSYEPPLLISELLINGLPQPAGRILDGLDLAPWQRSFSIGFTALDYSDPGRIRYAYRLQGFDPDWIATAADSRVAAYSNLDPGGYVLRVRASNRSGIWSPHELAIPVRILPAWWQSWWFRSLAGLALVLLVVALLQLRTRRLRRRQVELERTVRERTADLEKVALALQRESAALAESSLTDPLTGLRNRRFLTQHIEADCALTVRAYEGHRLYGAELPADPDLIFFLFDIDHFKRVNDEHGHAAGDAVLLQVCSRLAGVFRDTDYLVRWGGEEFLVVARATTRAGAAELAERARAAVADQPFRLDDGGLLARTCSVGFCCLPLSSEHPAAVDWSAVVNIADAALYLVKSSGRNGWLGVISARAESAAALRQWSRRPLPDWLRSGDVQVVCSPALAGLADAQWQAAAAAIVTSAATGAAGQRGRASTADPVRKDPATAAPDAPGQTSGRQSQGQSSAGSRSPSD